MQMYSCLCGRYNLCAEYAATCLRVWQIMQMYSCLCGRYNMCGRMCDCMQLHAGLYGRECRACMPCQGEFSDPAANAPHATAVLRALLGSAPMLAAWVWAIVYSVWTCGPCCTCSHTPPPPVHSRHLYIVCGGGGDGTTTFRFVLYSGSWILSFSCRLLAGQGGSLGC